MSADYTFSPTGPTSFNAGANQVFTLTARDPYGNGVINSDDVTLTAFGGASVTFVEGAGRNFAGDSVLTVTVTSTLMQNFTVRVVNDGSGEINGESDLVTVNPAGADHLTMLSTSDPINVRGSRLLRAALEDTYNNRITGSSVTFTGRRGNGYFGTESNSDTTVTVDQNGVYEVTYVASNSLTFVSDSIDVTSAGVSLVPQVFTLQQIPDNVTYYTFAPSGAQNITAGGNVVYTITARDQFGNGVLNDGSINLTAVGGTSVTFVEGTPLAFSGDSTATLTVTTDVAQSFTVRAENFNSSQIAGQSGLITVDPDQADRINVTSNLAAVTVGTERQIQFILEDQFGNPLPGETVTLTTTTGDAYFGSPGTTVATPATNASGIASATYTASSDLDVGTDVIQVTFGALIDTTISLPLQGGAVSYYTFTPPDAQSVTAGSNQAFTLTARDQFGNGVLNSGDITLSAIGGTSVNFVEGTARNFAGDSVLTVTVNSLVAQSFTVQALNNLNSQIKGLSGLITVTADVANQLAILPNVADPIVVGTSRLLRVRLEDTNGNPIASSLVAFTVGRGTGYFGTPGTQTTADQTDATGIAEVNYTASNTIAEVSDSIRVSFGAVTTDIVMTLLPGNVSYYTFTPPDAQSVTAGNNQAFTLTARDQFGNGVLNSGAITLSAIGGSSVNFVEGTARNFAGDSVLTVTVNSDLAQSFSVQAVYDLNNQIKGQSGLITVDPDQADQINVTSSLAAVTVATERQIQFILEDQYGNPLPGETVTLTTTTGDAYFGSPGTTVVTPATNASGVAEATYTASSDLSVGTDVIQVTFGALIDTTISIPLRGGAVSYYTFAPSGSQTATAGDSLRFVVTARDQYDNPIANTGFIDLTAIGSATAGFYIQPIKFCRSGYGWF